MTAVRTARVFLTLNILLSDRELPQALETARTAARLGVDAVLVQDWGLFDLLRRTLPDLPLAACRLIDAVRQAAGLGAAAPVSGAALPLHASTQMSIFTAGGANELAADGCERIVLARECSREGGPAAPAS